MKHEITFTKDDIIEIVRKHVNSLGLQVDETSIKYKGSASLKISVLQAEGQKEQPKPKDPLETLTTTEIPVVEFDSEKVRKTFLSPVDTDRSTKGLKTIEPPDTFEDSLARNRMNRPAPFSADKIRK